MLILEAKAVIMLIPSHNIEHQTEKKFSKFLFEECDAEISIKLSEINLYRK